LPAHRFSNIPQNNQGGDLTERNDAVYQAAANKRYDESTFSINLEKCMDQYQMLGTYDSNFKTVSKASSGNGNEEEKQPKIISYVTLGLQPQASNNNFADARGV